MPETPHSKYLAEVPKDAKDYPFIWLWHTKVLPAGGTEYIYGVIEQARREKAPPNAIYKGGAPGSPEWSTTDGIRNEAAFEALGCGPFPAPRKARYLREDAETARLEMERLYAEAERLSPSGTHRVTTVVVLAYATKEGTPTLAEAREVVRRALQVHRETNGHRIEQTDVCLDEFKVL